MSNITTTLLGPCQVRSGIDLPCRHPAMIQIRGIPFCEPCAREQEAYFAIGELTEDPRHLHQRSLIGMLDEIRRTRRRHEVSDHESEAA